MEGSIEEPEKINIFCCWKHSRKLADRYFSCHGRYESSNSAEKTCNMVGKVKKEIIQSLLKQNFFLMVYTVKEIIFVSK